MRVEFLDSFAKDLDHISTKQVKQAVEKLILRVESVSTPRAIPHLKKLAGVPHAFRVRLGEYRVGVFIEGDIVQFARILHRKDIYRVFP
jgi:mRNA interferase RelE/StbE